MRSIESRGKTIEDAVTQGLDRLGVSLGDVSIDIISEGSKGFLGVLGSKLAEVRLTVREEGLEKPSDPAPEQKKRKKPAREDFHDIINKEEPSPQAGDHPRDERRPRRGEAAATIEKAMPPKSAERTLKVKAPKAGKREQAQKSAPKGQTTVEELYGEAALSPKPEGGGPVQPAPLCDPATPQGKAQQFLLKVTELMGVQVSVAAGVDEEGNVRVNMQGDTLGILIGRRGETLDALQYLTSLYVNRSQEEYTRCTLDTENYRAKREEALTRLANRMASRAVKTGRKVVMEPMNPYERRILHNALQQNEAVTTHSEGDEPNRHVVITLRQS